MAREKYKTDEDFSFLGEWWDVKGTHRCTGNLAYSKNGIELELVGSFDDVTGFGFDRDLRKPTVIHGTSLKQTPVTLLNAFYKHYQPSGSLLSRKPAQAISSKIYANQMVFGAHIEEADDKCFNSCRYSLPNFDRWLDDRPFSFFDSEWMTQGKVEYKKPPDRCFEVPGEISSLKFESIVIPPSDPWSDARIEHETRVCIEPASPQSVDWYIQRRTEIERLFTLLFGELVHTSECALRNDLDFENWESFIYLRESDHNDRVMNPIDFLVRYPEIAEWFPSIVAKWFSESDEIQHALNLVFGSLFRPAPHMEERFLPFVQAVEVFSRVVAPGEFIPKEEYRKIRREIELAIPESLCDELKDSIKRSISHSNGPTLRERFHSLFSSMCSETVDLICSNPNDFVSGIVDTRNHLTHYGERKKTVLRGRGLHWATCKLQVMMKILLFLHVGVPEDVTRKIFKENHNLAKDRENWRPVPEVGA